MGRHRKKKDQSSRKAAAVTAGVAAAAGLTSSSSGTPAANAVADAFSERVPIPPPRAIRVQRRIAPIGTPAPKRVVPEAIPDASRPRHGPASSSLALSGQPAPSRPSRARTAPPVMASAGRPELVSLAKSYVGTPYKWGGRSSSGLDCSGLIYVVLKRAGVTSTYRTSSALREWATPILRSEAVPGDLVFGPHHVGIYAGDGLMIDAPDFGLKVDLRGVYKTMTSYGRIPT
jgi:cell wall-associated NlpC family hydrolase